MRRESRCPLERTGERPARKEQHEARRREAAPDPIPSRRGRGAPDDREEHARAPVIALPRDEVPDVGEDVRHAPSVAADGDLRRQIIG